MNFSVQFVCINSFGAITSRRYFLEELTSYQTEATGFFCKEIAKVVTCIFFAIKVFTQLLRNFLKFAATIVILCARSIHWNDRRSRHAFLRFFLAIFSVASVRFPTLVVMYMACSVHRGHVTAL